MDAEEIYRQIGDLIRRRRKQLKLTQEALAKQLQISRGSLANIETGKQRILVHHLYDFASALSLPASDFLPRQIVAGVRDEIAELPLPSDLKRDQKEQIARMLRDVPLVTLEPGVRDDKSRKA